VPASVERIDEFNDLALLRCSGELAVNPLRISKGDAPSPGTTIYSISNPAGLERSMSTGVVSAIRELSGRKLLQITAPISPGSSGGPILNSSGEVVGVAVAILQEGQNLNFAVPAEQLRKLLAGPVEGPMDAKSLLQRVKAIRDKRDQLPYSGEEESDWQKYDREIDGLLQAALESAGNDHQTLLGISQQALSENNTIAITAAERVVQMKPVAEAHLVIAEASKSSCFFPKDADEERESCKRAEKALRAAMQMTRPTARMYRDLALVVENQDRQLEAESNFRRALEVSSKIKDETVHRTILRGLIRTAFASGKTQEGEAWFKAFHDSGLVESYDWEQRADRLFNDRNYFEPGKCYQQAAASGTSWRLWCSAALSYWLSPSQEDLALFTARKCVGEASGQGNSERSIALAHRIIAQTLNGRGVYQEALSHANEAIALDPTESWHYQEKAEALFGLRRFHEAINASNLAIKLSDGKYAAMHFTLGSAYFSMENWEFARQSYEKAATLMPTDSAAAYNVALCLARLGYYRDAANWFEEVLRRDPKHENRADILERIRKLRY